MSKPPSGGGFVRLAGGGDVVDAFRIGGGGSANVLLEKRFEAGELDSNDDIPTEQLADLKAKFQAVGQPSQEGLRPALAVLLQALVRTAVQGRTHLAFLRLREPKYLASCLAQQRTNCWGTSDTPIGTPHVEWP